MFVPTDQAEPNISHIPNNICHNIFKVRIT